jgi:4'-phosphopantetheinyl transferase
MPLSYSEIISNDIQICIWQITEDEVFLSSGLSMSQEASERLSSRKSKVHRKGYLAIRQLLKGCGIIPEIHQYDQDGAPFLTDGRYLSITHTKNMAAIAISFSPVGIDLEHYQEKIKKIAARFLHMEESKDYSKTDNIEFLTQIWTAKEAIYKAFRTPGIHFNTQLLVEPFQSKAARGVGHVLHHDKDWLYSLNFRYFKDYCLTLASPRTSEV